MSAGLVQVSVTVARASSPEEGRAQDWFATLYSAALDELERRVRPSGLGLADVVSMIEHVGPSVRGQYRQARDVRRERFGEVLPCSAVIVRHDHEAGHAMLTLEATLARGPKRAVVIDSAHVSSVSYSAAVIRGQNLFLSGYAAIDLSTGRSVAPEEELAQRRHAWASVDRVLEAAGSSRADITSVQEFVVRTGTQDVGGSRPATDPSGSLLAGPVAGQLPGRPLPSSAWVTTCPCDGLIREELMFEVVVTATIGTPAVPDSPASIGASEARPRA